MGVGVEPRQPDDRAAGIRSPVRCEQPGECRHEVNAAVVGDLTRQRLALGGTADDAQLITQPLHGRTGDRDRPLQRVHGFGVTELVAHRGQQPVLGADDLLAGVEQQEIACAVSVLGLAGVQAHLSDHRRLLIAEDAGQRHLPADRSVVAGDAVGRRVRRRRDVRQHLPRNVEERQQFVVPVQRLQVHQHGAAGVGDVGDVHPAARPAGQIPQHPGVGGAEDRVAVLGVAAHPVDVLQDPLHLAAGEVGGRRQPGLAPDHVAAAVTVQRRGDAVGAGVLPHDRVVVGPAGVPVPHQRWSPAGW